MNDYRKEFERFLREQKKLSKGTCASYLGDYSNLVAFARRQGINDLKLMTAGELNAFVRWLNAQEKSPATVNRSISSIRCFFSALQSYGIIQQSPAQWLICQKLPKREPSASISPEAFSSLLCAIRSDLPSGARDLVMICILKESGVRVNDLLQMDVTDVDLQSGRFVCGNVQRQLPVLLLEKLQAYLPLREKLQKDHNDPALFLNQYGRRMSRQGLWKQIKKYAAQANLHDSAMPSTLF